MKAATPSEERRDALARSRTVKGWAFRKISLEEEKAIREFLAGGPVPEGYEGMYNLNRRHLGLPEL